MTRRAFNPFTCPNCKALYQVVKIEAGPETKGHEIACRVCGVPLAGREGKPFDASTVGPRPPDPPHLKHRAASGMAILKPFTAASAGDALAWLHDPPTAFQRTR